MIQGAIKKTCGKGRIVLRSLGPLSQARVADRARADQQPGGEAAEAIARPGGWP